MMTKIYNTMLFSEVFKDEAEFVNGWKECKLYDESIAKDNELSRIYYLLYAEYGNNAITGHDINQWKYRLWSDIRSYTPTFLEKERIQKNIRKLTDEQIKIGTKAINNSAKSPAVANTTTSMNEIQYIDAQTVTNYKKSMIEAYSDKLVMLNDHLEKDYVDKFRRLFLSIVYNQNPLLYIEED